MTVLEPDEQAWLDVLPTDAWVFDKLIVNRLAGNVCGPRGVPVPHPGYYCVRPAINTFGMGIGARIQMLYRNTYELELGYFWAKKLDGAHISIDYVDGKQILAVRGTRASGMPLHRFDKWEVVRETIDLPVFLEDIATRYPKMNCEYIGNKLIEVHLRHNPDFAEGHSTMIPRWYYQDLEEKEGYTYVSDGPGAHDRVGRYISNW